MSAELEKLIQETLGNLDAFTRDKVPQLIQEALKAFTTLSQKGQSTDPKEREEAYRAAASLKAVLEAQSEELTKSYNVEPESLKELSENEEVMNADTWTELKNAKEELDALRHQMGLKPKKTAPAAKKSKAHRITV
jgi:hypothetical protein